MKAVLNSIGAVVVIVLAWAGLAGAQDTLPAARQLYAAASYDEALAMLDRMKAGGGGEPAGVRLVEQYRAFCLLALGQQSDAERAMEAIVVGDPAFKPDASDLSPRLQAVFRDVRKRTLPAVVRQRYASAKASFDSKEYTSAGAQFDALITLARDPELAASDPSLADIVTLASGFRDLAKAASAPPPPAPASPPAATPEPAPAAPITPAPAYYTASDTSVIAPVVIRQEVPRWPQAIPMSAQRGQRALLDIIVNEQGAVESAAVRPSITAWFDEALVSEAKRWKYKPATKDGVPVKFRKMIQVVIDR